MGFVSICVTGRLDVWKGADSAERCVQVLEQHMLPQTSLDFHQRKTFFLEWYIFSVETSDVFSVVNKIWVHQIREKKSPSFFGKGEKKKNGTALPVCLI